MLGKLGNRNLLAVDWDARRLRLVHASSRKSGVRIDRMLSVDVAADIDASNPEAMGALLRQVLNQEKIRTDRVILAVPRDQSLLTTLKLPIAAVDEMPAMVEYQIGKEIPFPVSEAIVDFAMPHAPIGSVAPTMVGTVRKKVVAYYEHASRAAGLKLERLALRPYANKVSVNALVGGGAVERVVFVDVGPTLTEIDVIADGMLSFSRAASVVVPLGADSSTGEESAADAEVVDDVHGSAIIQFPRESPGGSKSSMDQAVSALLVEVTRSLEAYRASEPGTHFGRIVVGGSVGVEQKLAEALGRRLDTTVELYNPARQLGWDEQRGEAALGFAAAIGLVTGHVADDLLDFDFVHPKKALSQTERRMRRVPALATVVLLFVAAGVVWYFRGVRPQKIAYQDLQKQIKQYKNDIDELEEYEQTIQYADDFEKEQVIWIDELDRVLDCLPDNKEMVLEHIDMYQKNARMYLPLNCTEFPVATSMMQQIKDFRPPGSETQYYNATVLGSQGSSGKSQYPISTAIDVKVQNKAG